MTFLQGTGHIRDTDTYGNHIVVGQVPVLNQTKHIHIEHGEIHLQVFVNLTLCHLGISVEVAKRLVDHIQHLAAVLLLAEHLTALGMHRVQVVAFHHQFSHLLIFLRHTVFGHNQLELHVVVVLLVASQLFHVLRVVGIVIDRGHRTQLVEAFYQHTLRVHICKAQRTDNLFHSFLATPFLYGGEERFRHFDVVDKVNPSEAYTLGLPPFVGTMVDDGGNTSHNLSVPIGQEILCLTEFKGGVLVFSQRVHLVGEKIRRIKLVATIQVIVEVDKRFQTSLV